MSAKISGMKKNYRKCCVTGCNTKQWENLEIAFHSFPKENSSIVQRQNLFGKAENIDRRKVWFTQLKMKINSDVSSKTVCSKHFKNDDYYLSEYEGLKKILLKTAIPTQNLPTENPRKKESKDRNLDRESRTANRKAKKLCSTSKKQVANSLSSKNDETNDDNLEVSIKVENIDIEEQGVCKENVKILEEEKTTIEALTDNSVVPHVMPNFEFINCSSSIKLEFLED